MNKFDKILEGAVYTFAVVGWTAIFFIWAVA
jgi:hypothetical protein